MRTKNGMYWYFRYPAAEEGGRDMVVATSRPETMFGKDVAIAVHPDDQRYKDMGRQRSFCRWSAERSR